MLPNRIRVVGLYDLLKRRRAVRLYTGERVPREALERIAATVRKAPSAGFSQGVRALVVDDPELLAAITALEDDESSRAWFGSAGAHILVLVREQDYHDRYTQADKLAITGGTEIQWPVPFWHVDAGAAFMLVLLAAIEEGLAAGVYGVTVETDQQWRELLHIPDDLAIVAGATIGVPAPDPDKERRSSVFSQRRKPLDEVVRWNTWD
jgi:FMN reductase [NAD(P)H]